MKFQSNRMFVVLTSLLIFKCTTLLASSYVDSPWETMDTTAPWERNVIGVEVVPVEPKLAESLASVLGHSFIRIVDDGPAEDNWTIGFTGYYWDDQNQKERPATALSGLGLANPYPLYVEFKTLKEITNHYSEHQHRFMQRYIIPMSKEELENFKTIVKENYELSKKRELGGYRFLDKNCTSELIQIIFEALRVEPRFLFIKQKQKFATPVAPKPMAGVLKKFGLILPRIGVVDAHSHMSSSLEANWGGLQHLYSWCPVDEAQTSCFESWIDEAYEKMGRGWVKDLYRFMSSKKSYIERASPEFLDFLKIHYDQLTSDHSY